jgi:hypothetical protein
VKPKTSAGAGTFVCAEIENAKSRIKPQRRAPRAEIFKPGFIFIKIYLENMEVKQIYHNFLRLGGGAVLKFSENDLQHGRVAS